ncbi:23S rRNA (guanosine(2251)-2'-O)-methyltransferase RlmB [Candidatus Dependentiae bacterium]|nr:23S rRNA (guanosine(2251)-2'-O)-methyltransferase RlmB [Candidatus Dependentiae bacterium]
MKKGHVKKTSVNQANIVYGVHSVLELLTAKRRKVSMVYTVKPLIKSWSRIQGVLPSYVQIQYVDRITLENICGSSEHQGIVAVVQPFPFESKIFDAKKFPFLVVLDGIQDVRNLGAIIRSAYCAGVDGIILSGKSSAPLTAAAIKASAGLAEHSRIYIASTLSLAMSELVAQGYHIYLATLGQGENAAQISYKAPSVLVIGNEESGISKDILSSGTRVLLPQRRSDISYNASVAAGILLFLMGVQFKKI